VLALKRLCGLAVLLVPLQEPTFASAVRPDRPELLPPSTPKPAVAAGSLEFGGVVAARRGLDEPARPAERLSLFNSFSVFRDARSPSWRAPWCRRWFANQVIGLR